MKAGSGPSLLQSGPPISEIVARPNRTPQYILWSLWSLPIYHIGQRHDSFPNRAVLARHHAMMNHLFLRGQILSLKALSWKFAKFPLFSHYLTVRMNISTLCIFDSSGGVGKWRKL